MQSRELAMVRFALIVVFSSLMTIYLLVYQIKGESLKLLSAAVEPQQNDEQQLSDQLTSTESTGEEKTLPINTGLLAQESQQKSGTKLLPETSTSLFTKQNTKTWLSMSTTGNMQILSGTLPFYGKIPSIELLGIRYAYVLKDTKNTYFINLGLNRYDFDDIMRKLWGTVYKMTTEQEILQNKLFGEKILFLNIPQYKDKKVLLVVSINTALRLIDMDYQNYHKSKWYLKSLFIE